MRRFLLLGAIGVVGLVGCGDDDEGGAGSVEQYCEKVAELDRLGDEAFEGLDENSDEADFEAAFRAFVEENEDRLRDLRDSAPAEIRADVEILLEAVEAGLFFEDDEPPAEVTEAEERLEAFEDENCGPDEDQ